MMNYAGSLYWEPISLLLTLCCLTKLNFDTDSKANPPPFVLIRLYAVKRICRVSCEEYAGNSFMPWRYPAMHSSGPPFNTLVWWSRKVCKISSHSLQAFKILFLLAVSVCETKSPVYMPQCCHWQITWITDSSQLLTREKKDERRAVEVLERSISQVLVDQARIFSFDILGGLH